MVPLSVNQIEGATLTAWPSLLTAHDGLWLWRYARGYTKRGVGDHTERLHETRPAPHGLERQSA